MTGSVDGDYCSHEKSPLLPNSSSLYLHDVNGRVSAPSYGLSGFPIMLKPKTNLQQKYSIAKKESYKTFQRRRLDDASYGSIFDSSSSPESLMKRVLGRIGKGDGPEQSDNGSNQSDTDSESDGTNSRTTRASSSCSLPSILRVRSDSDNSGPPSLRKQNSVGFMLDLEADDHPVGGCLRRNCYKGQECVGRCQPRRLTIEEKAELYLSRPDLALTPAVFLQKEVDERRRRRHRNMLFSILAGTLLFFLVMVTYYLILRSD